MTFKKILVSKRENDTMYEYVGKTERDAVVELSDKLIKAVQKSVSNYFTFDIRLIGSGEKRLLTKNGVNGEFDLDYNLVLHKDKQGIISNQKKIKEIFLNSFNIFAPSYGFKSSQDSTSVITSKIVRNGRLSFSIDIAILIEGNNGNYYKLIFDKLSGRYFWNEIKKTKNYQSKYKKIKKNGDFVKFRSKYIYNKNRFLRNNSDVNSFSVFLETLNEFR